MTAQEIEQLRGIVERSFTRVIGESVYLILNNRQTDYLIRLLRSHELWTRMLSDDQP